MSKMSLNKLTGREHLNCRIGIVQAISLTPQWGFLYGSNRFWTVVGCRGIGICRMFLDLFKGNTA